MPSVFNQAQIDAARYGYQMQTYTWGPATLNPGPIQIFSVQAWNPPSGDINKICVIESIAATQNASVQLQWTYDGVQSDSAQGWTDGFPAGLRRYPTRIIAAKQLSLVATNQSGASISDFQLNYEVSVLSLNAAQRLLLGYQLTSMDAAAIADLQNRANAAAPEGVQPTNVSSQITSLMKSGQLPLSLEHIYENLFANRRVSNPALAVPIHLTIATGQTVSSTRTINVPTGMVYILRGIAMEGASVVTLSIDRDGDGSYINALNGAAFVQADDLPWRFFVPFKDHIAASISGSPGTYPVRIDVDAYVASDLMLQHLLVQPMSASVEVGMR